MNERGGAWEGPEVANWHKSPPASESSCEGKMKA